MQLIKKGLSSKKYLQKKVDMDLSKWYERYAEYFRITFPFAALPTYEEWFNDVSATSSAGVSMLMNEAAFAGNKQKSALEKKETKENRGLKNKAQF